MTADVAGDLGFDDFSDVVGEAQETPVSASRGTRGGTRGRRRSATSKKIDTLQKKLSSEMFQAGSLVGLGLPVTGYYVCQESDAFTKAVVQLALKRPEWVDALEHIANIGPGLIVGRTALGIGGAFAVDRKRVDPEKSKALKFLGVYAAWQAVNQPNSVTEEGNAYVPPPAGKFVPVG